MDNRNFAGTDVLCREVGRLIHKGSCYALHVESGAQIWLEMDSIPLHLVNEQVRVVGSRHAQNLILVNAIGPV